ncbi:hypothetical protein FBUS_03516 [Fasciolopsis buskii]|uniref:Uncharacterized protein n=1 Tax=Fasciolopsis buskii TaxID=27845 RepID=A0A8E0S2E1_9TREM|nr:hypothetical protein FBUS_03516 [Fasciolopsis buski]
MEATSLLNEEVLFELAVELREQWEDVVRNGLLATEKKQGNDNGCLPIEQVQICRNMAPREPIIQAFHALARWRWFCWYVCCSERKAIATLLAACKKAGVRIGDKLNELNVLTSSIDFV